MTPTPLTIHKNKNPHVPLQPKLRARRAQYNLPATTTGRTGTPIPITEDLCLWLETIIETLGIQWRIQPSNLNHGHHPDSEYVLILNTKGYRQNQVTVQFNQDGRWLGVSAGKNSLYANTPNTHINEVLTNVSKWLQNRTYDQLLSQPNPPAWVTAEQNRRNNIKEQNDRLVAEAETARRSRIAREHAIEELISLHTTEYQELLEKHSIIIALQN